MSAVGALVSVVHGMPRAAHSHHSRHRSDTETNESESTRRRRGSAVRVALRSRLHKRIGAKPPRKVTSLAIAACPPEAGGGASSRRHRRGPGPGRVATRGADSGGARVGDDRCARHACAARPPLHPP